MFTLDAKDVVLNQSFANKKDAITFLANRLIEAGIVKDKYDECMLEREAQNAPIREWNCNPAWYNRSA